MSRSVEQIYVKGEKQAEVIAALRRYCSTVGMRLTRHPRFPLSGMNHTKKAFMKSSRRFIVSGQRDAWIGIWEQPRYTYCSFADPEVARYLSNQFATTALLIDLDESYNIWCFQEYRDGELLDEAFLPEEYFLKETEDVDFKSYGYCFALAERFHRKHKLPYFLEDPTLREGGDGLPRGFKRVIFRLK